MARADGGTARAQLPRVVAAWPLFASRFALLIGSLVLAGWSLDIDLLKRVIPGFVAMNPATATLFVFAGVALDLVVRWPEHELSRRAVTVLSSIIVVAAASELLEVAGFWHSAVDEVLFRTKIAQTNGGLPNRMAPNTALNFFLTGLSLVMIGHKRTHALAQGLAVIVCFGALLPLTGYVYGVRSFEGGASFIPMAVHTAATFMVLGGGLFFAVPDAGLTEVFSTNDARGVLARRLFPAVVAVTLCLGWVRLSGERNHLYEPALGTALYAITLSVLLTCLVRWSITAVGKVEAQRAAAHARLAALNRRKDELIAVVSHDLCSPLTGFRMVIHLLRENRESEAEVEMLDLMDHSADRMVAMVRGLLDVSKLQSDEVQLERSDVRVSEIIRESMEPLRINANAKQIALKLEVASDEPTIYADPLRIAQIFNNLLSNAVKFTPPGGSVSATAVAYDGGVCIAIADTGLGIAESELPHIFDKYHQSSTKPTAGEIGAGLGLAIVRELVSLHNGRIEVRSEVGRGTTFTVYLPRDSMRPQP